MSNNLLNIISSAQKSKQEFDMSVDCLKDTLHRSVVTAQSEPRKVEFTSQKVETTGWLKGALSYPWVVVCIVVPAVMEVI